MTPQIKALELLHHVRAKWHNFLLTSAFFLASFRLKHRKMIWWRHHDVTMTLQLLVFAKRSYMIYFVDIFLLCKFEVFYTRFNFQNIGKFKHIAPAGPPYRNRVDPFSIGIFYSTRYIMNPRIFWRLFLLLFKFLITFFADFVTLFLINL